MLVAVLTGMTARAALTAEEATSEALSRRVIAMFVFPARGASQETAGAIKSLIQVTSREIPDIALVRDGQLRQVLGSSPEDAMAHCGGDLQCMAILGAKVQADEVVYARVIPLQDVAAEDLLGTSRGPEQAAGQSIEDALASTSPLGPSLERNVADADALMVQVLAVDVQSRLLKRKIAFDIPELQDLRATVLQRLPDIFGMPAVGYLELPGFRGDVVVDGETVGRGPGPHAVEAGVHDVMLGRMQRQIVILPATKRSISDATLAAPPSSQASQLMTDPGDPQVARPHPSRAEVEAEGRHAALIDPKSGF